MGFDHQDFAADGVCAKNSHPLEKVPSHYEEEVVLTSPRIGLIGKEDDIIRGKAAMRDRMGVALRKISDLRFTLDRVFSGVNSVRLAFHTTGGRHGTDFMELGRGGLVWRVSATHAAG